MQLHDNSGTPEQWAQYEIEKKEFEKKLNHYRHAFIVANDIARRKLNLTEHQQSVLMEAFDSEIIAMQMCDAPNVPGYLYANND
jgi:hypothetical protein